MRRIIAIWRGSPAFQTLLRLAERLADALSTEPAPPFPGGDALTRGVCYQSLKDRSDLTKSSQDRRFGGVIETFLPFSAQLGEEWTHVLDPPSVTLTADRKPSRQRPSQVTRSKD